MTERITTTGIFKKSGEEIALSELNIQFETTEAGQKLKKMTRFGKFQPNEVPIIVWKDYIGPHGIISDHMLQTRVEAEQFMEGCPGMFTGEEQKLVLATAQLHDLGEAIIGDIPFIEKTSDHHKAEMEALLVIVNEELFSDVDFSERFKFITDVHAILGDESLKLGRAFHAIERMGYVNAALHAWENVNDEESDLQNSLRILAHQVIPTHIPTLVDFSEEYPPVKNYLIEHGETIRNIMDDSFFWGTQIDEEFEEALDALSNFNQN